MKKITKIVFSILTLITLTACTTNAEKADETKQNSNDEVVLYVTRHGKTMFNSVHRAQGWADTPLTDDGIEVAQQLGEGLKADNVDFVSVYSSDLGRSRETAKVVLNALGQEDFELNEDERLRESCFGIFEGDTDDNMWGPVAKNLGFESLEAWRSSDQFSVEEGLDELAKIDSSSTAEAFGEVRDRMQSALKDIAEETAGNGGGNVLVVSHGIAILALISDMTEDVPANGAIANASVTKIVYTDGNFEVKEVANTKYIEKD